MEPNLSTDPTATGAPASADGQTPAVPAGRAPSPPIIPGRQGPATPAQPSDAALAPPPAQAPRACPACGAAIAADQRYCLECGERQIGRSDFLFAGAGGAAVGGGAPAPPLRPVAGDDSGDERRRRAWLLLGLVGVLLLAMGVGVLIGKAGKTPTLPTKVIQVEGHGGGGGGETPTATEAGFSSDWPSGKSGYTVELKTLPSGSSAAAVAAAKSAATSAGASGVGALKAEEFSSLGGSEYVIYSGQYASRSAANAALSPLKKKFPGAKVIEVSNKESSSGPAESNAEEKKKKSGDAITKPESLEKAEKQSGHPKSEQEESEKLPDNVVVE
ncbi:MAG TPA: hypothetical protein VMA83_03235 [Solirubrobacteraceae bacterium]|nr:hypothetical protein [Solirubrobacteraceae bacterium]